MVTDIPATSGVNSLQAGGSHCPPPPAVEEASDTPSFQVAAHTFHIANNKELTILLNQVEKKTYYGDDIKLTGHSIWFGGLNMVSLLTTLPSRPGMKVLELGAGTGIAGLFYASLTKSVADSELTLPTFLLTDGESTVRLARFGWIVFLLFS